MAKTLSNTSNTPKVVSGLSGIATAAIRFLVSVLGIGAQSGAEALPARLRHDLGELDLNPVLDRGHCASRRFGCQPRNDAPALLTLKETANSSATGDATCASTSSNVHCPAWAD